MSFDDDLRARMRDAAEAAGRDARPDLATAHLAANAGTAAARAISVKLIAGLGAVGLVGGVLLGATALRPDAAGAAVDPGVQVEVGRGLTLDCPDGTVVGDLRAGDRVYVIGRDESGEWSAIRDPRAIDRTVWLPTAALDPDLASPPEVPVVACDTAVFGDAPPTSAPSSSVPPSTAPLTTAPVTTAPVTTAPITTAPSTSAPSATTTAATTTVAPPTPTVGPGTTTAPTTTAAPATTATSTTTTTTTTSTTTTTTVPPDTVPPTVQGGASPSEIFPPTGNCPSVSQLTAFASDNVGVTSVTGTYGGGLPGSPLTFVRQGPSWTASFGPFAGLPAAFNQQITITITARDAAGNTASSNVLVRVWGTCLE